MGALQEILKALGRIIISPFKNLSALWVLAPVLILWIVLVIYFDEYKKETLGWNTAIGNGISMFWIAVSCMRYVFETKSFTFNKLAIVISVLAYALFIAIISFRHTFKAKITYALAAPTPVYYMSAVSVVVAYDSLDVTRWVLLSLIILFAFLLLIGFIMKKWVIKGKEEEDYGEELGGDEGMPSMDEPLPGTGDDLLKDLKL